MNNPTSKLIKREEVANGTMAFYFTKPDGFTFRPGQSIDIFLIDPPETDAEGNKRAFSIASLPEDEFIMVATRMRDTAFKRVLKTMPLETAIDLQGPFGSFHLHNDESKPAVFLAGGIGITPFRSMVLEAAAKRLSHKIYLFYSNRTPHDAAFADVLEKAHHDNPNFMFIQTMTGTNEGWTGEKGYINADMLKRHIPDLSAPIYYMAGPSKMVSSLKDMLMAAGVDEDAIRYEEMTGY